MRCDPGQSLSRPAAASRAFRDSAVSGRFIMVMHMVTETGTSIAQTELHRMKDLDLGKDIP
jgi:hypothetical protein